MTRRLREATLWAGAALGVLSVVAGTAVMFFGFTFLIFRSGSMGPEIPTGSLALARTVPAAELEVGDVVSVLAANGARITHRLVSSTVRGDEASLILQGDTNATPDQEIYQVTEAERSIVSVPYAGYVVTVLLSPAGLLAAVCLSGMLMLLAFGSQPTREGGPTPPGGRHRGDNPGRGRRSIVGAGVVATVTVTVSAAGLGVSGTSAYFSDQGTVTGANKSFTAATIATPATPSTKRLPLSVTVSWNPETSVGATKVTAYQVVRYTTATGGTGTVACTTAAPTLSCIDGSPNLVLPSYYLVRARIGANWSNDSARVLCCSDGSPTTVVITSPSANEYNKRSDLQNAVKDACEALGLKEDDTPACGSATDADGISQVAYQLERRAIGLLGLPTGTRQCYDGAAEQWSTTCIQRAAEITKVNATTWRWQIPNKAKAAYDKDNYSYTLSIIATDALGNVSSTSTIQYSVTGE